MLALIGIVIVVVGFAAGINPLLVVVTAALASGLLAGLAPLDVVAALGKAFNQNRFVSVVWIILPVVGLLERYGLQARARDLVGRLKRSSPGGILTGYMLARQITAALGLNALGGHPQMVRPLIAPMAEAAAERMRPDVDAPLKETIRANAAASDNMGAFFGEDIFIAFGSILLIKAVLKSGGVEVSPLALSAWAAPTAILAFVVHAVRMARLDRRLRRLKGASGPAVEADPDGAAP